MCTKIISYEVLFEDYNGFVKIINYFTILDSYRSKDYIGYNVFLYIYVCKHYRPEIMLRYSRIRVSGSKMDIDI